MQSILQKSDYTMLMKRGISMLKRNRKNSKQDDYLSLHKKVNKAQKQVEKYNK